MSNDFDSSDAFRHARPLQHAETVTLEEPLELERGGRLPQVTVAYETYGMLNEQRDNGVLVCLDGKTGTEIYRKRLGGACNSSPVRSSGSILRSSDNGCKTTVVSLRASTTSSR